MCGLRRDLLQYVLAYSKIGGALSCQLAEAGLLVVFAVIHLAYRLIVLHLSSYISFVIGALEMFYDDDDDDDDKASFDH